MFLAGAYLLGIPYAAVELRHLRYFVAVAEMENVSRAATQTLHVAQPSLSRQIRDLEDEVGVQLLERTAKSVRLTDAGRAFLDDARAILKQADEAVLKARAISGKQELPVGDWPLGTGRIMPELLRAYQREMPNVHVKLHDWNVDKNIDGVRDRRLQLAIIVQPLRGNPLGDLRFEEVANVRVCLAVSSDHRFSKKKSVPLIEAAREPFIGLIRERYPRNQEYLDAIFAGAPNKPRVVEEHDGWAGVYSSVASGAGVAISSNAFSHLFGERVKFVPLTPEPRRAVIGIITRKGKLGPAAEKFCQCAKEVFKALR